MPGRTEGILKGIAIAAAVAAVIGAVLWQRCGLRGCPDVDLLAAYVPDEASAILDRDGEEISKLYLVQRTVVRVDSLPEHVPAAFVAIEDQRFWDHDGVDWRRVPGAVLANVRAGAVEQGFSTITMQLARNLFPEKLPMSERTIWRKLGEMRVAKDIEERYSKDEILEMYLNQIYFGSGAWGIEAAAHEYFGESATELSVAEAAMLAGVVQAPSRHNPRDNPEGALERRNLVLERMAEQGHITAAEAQEARDVELRLARTGLEAAKRAPYFVEAVRKVLEEQLGDMIYTAGLRVHTTLDADFQVVAEEELRRQLAAIEAGRYGSFRHARYDPTVRGEQDETTPYLQGALVLLESQTGNVLALVGGRDFEHSKFNRAIQAKRQPGSAFKPFVYATAVARGYPPTYPLDDTPLTMTIDGRTWTPRNFGNSYAGRVTLRDGLVQSRNVATVRLAERVGLSGVAGTAHALGIDEEIPAYPSIALGSIDVSLIEMVAAYGVFATLGRLAEPRLISRVEDRSGRIVWQQPVQTRQVLDPATAFIITTMLQDVVNRGTATAVRAVGYRGTAAGKTGTTNDGADAWFVGFTPNAVAGVWIGLDDPETIVPGATGGGLAAPVWGRLMRRVGAGGGSWSAPPGVEQHQIDEAGNLLVEGCVPVGAVRQEYFVRGTVAAATSCFEYLALSEYNDSLYLSRSEWEEEGWFERFRRRLFGDEVATDTLDPDSARPAAADTVDLEELDPQRRSDTQARRLGERRLPPLTDSGPAQPVPQPPPLLGDSIDPDTSAVRH